MLRWIVPGACVALIASGLAWLLRTKQGAHVRRQLTKQGQLMRKQGERTFDQVSRQLQDGVQDLLKESRRLVNYVPR